MRLLVTADLHYNHGKSKPLADDLIDQMNRAGGDVLLLAGDTAVSDGDALERCLSRFQFAGPKLFLPGNHELWTAGDDSYAIFTEQLPRRIEALGWQWLQTQPFLPSGRDLAIVGSIGWYDYSFAEQSLGIPLRFYRGKISPGAAAFVHSPLLEEAQDVPPHAMEIVARWNDGRYIKLHRPDEVFLDELLNLLDRQLQSLAAIQNVIAATHHLPFRALLPPSHNAQWDFAKAYLGGQRLGELLLRFPNIRHALCGHSHFPAEATVGHIHALNIGSGYRAKKFVSLDL